MLKYAPVLYELALRWFALWLLLPCGVKLWMRGQGAG